MKKFKKMILMKRFLAMFLAVIMVAGLMPPATINAASVNEVGEASGQEPLDESETVTAGDDAAEAVETAENLQEDGEMSENASEAEGMTENLPKAEEDAVETEREAAVQADKELPTAVLSVDAEILTDSLGGYSYDYATETVEAVYKRYEASYAKDIAYAVEQAVSVKVGYEVNAALNKELKTVWEKLGADGKTYAPMTGEPWDAGMYRLAISLDDVVDVCKAAEPVYVNLQVKKAAFTLEGVQDTAAPGISAGDLIRKQEIYLLLDGSEVLQNDYLSGSISSQVKKLTADGETLSDSDILQKNQDYVLVVNVPLKSDIQNNYEVKETVYPVILGNTTATKIDVSGITTSFDKVYDGKTIRTADVQKDYTSNARVFYDKNGDGEVDDEDAVLAGATLTGVWCRSEQNTQGGTVYKEYEEDFAPVDAGDYYYKLIYKDETGTYAEAEAYVKVTIAMADLVIEPEFKSTNRSLYDTMTAGEILKETGYKAYRVTDGNKGSKAEIIDEYYWGVAYNADGATGQYYEPVFTVQRGETKDGKTNWIDIPDEEMLKRTEGSQEGYTYSYRIIFSGLKAVYTADGQKRYEKDINASQENYHVDTSDKAIEDNACSLDVKTGTKVVITADDLLEGSGLVSDLAFGKDDGKTYDNPIEKSWSGDSLYKIKEDYKKAVVKSGDTVLAQRTDEELTYRWKQIIGLKTDTDAEGNTVVTGYEENVRNYNNVEWKSAPYEIGLYRLEISYTDPMDQYYAEPFYIYYLIRPQDAVVVLEGEPAIYADGYNTVYDLLYGLQHDDKNEAETWVGVQMYPVTLSMDADSKKVSYIKGEKPLEEADLWNLKYREEASEYYYVEKLESTGADGKETWTRCNNWDVLEKDGTYRLGVNICADGYYGYNYAYYSSEYANYNIGRYLTAEDIMSGRTNDRADVTDEEKHCYTNETVPVRMKPAGETEVRFEVEAEDVTKIYDGKPFDIEDLKERLKVKTVAGDTDVTDQVKDRIHYEFVETDESVNPGVIWSAGSETHKGIYNLRISIETDDVYRASRTTLETEFEILPKELILTPELTADIKAGQYVSQGNTGSIVKDFMLTDDSGNAQGENRTYKALITEVQWSIYENVSDNVFRGQLKNGEHYYVKASNWTWDKDVSYYVSRDYTVKEELSGFTPMRAAAEVKKIDTALKDDSRYSSDDESYTHVITPQEGIPYYTSADGITTVDGDVIEGNFFRVRINAPAELRGSSQTFRQRGYIYENSIKAAKDCYILTEGMDALPYIDVAVEASKGGTRSFDIYWDQDYKETFTIDLTSCVREDDFTKAVAAKSLSFNGAVSKMAVGDVQQLNVKITRAQMSDIILLGYEVVDAKPAVAGTEVLKVTDTGYVTALSKGTASVRVFPCRMEDGKKVEITEEAGRPVKKVTVKITVTDVAAPKISGVTAVDTKVTLKYTKPANGYRREVYILEGNKKTADFENILKDVKNGDLSAFVYAQYISAASEQRVMDSKGLVTLENLASASLKPGTEYTIYVRNVSGLRRLEDSSEVAVSYAGNVKKFKTTKAQEVALGATLSGDTVQPVEYGDDVHFRVYYEAEFLDKKAQLSVEAMFYQQYSKTEPPYPDDPDYIVRSLPLTDPGEKNAYQAPKIEYYVSDHYYKKYGESYIGDDSVPYAGAAGNLIRARYTDCYQNNTGGSVYYWDKTSQIASVNKSNGKVTFKGVGTVYLIAVDKNTGNGSAVQLCIKANPDKLKGKNITLPVGQTVDLSDYLEYSEGNKKIINYKNNVNLVITDIESDDEDSFRIRNVGNDYKITALRGNGKIKLTVMDKAVEKQGGAPVVLTVSSSAIVPVKNLKVSNVYDDRFTVSFTYPEKGRECKFRFELKDARGKIIKDEILSPAVDSYNAKSAVYTYKTTLQYPQITRLSNYTLSVKAVYEPESLESTPAKTGVKTKNIPASYVDVDQNNPDKADGGTDVVITTNVDNKTGSAYSLMEYPVLKAGNSYTLSVPLTGSQDNPSARTRKTDTLTWKSSNPGVASIGVNAGSYTATLKTVKSGCTTIQVTSKVTQKVIARWTVWVNATGDAGGYFDVNEPYNGKGSNIASAVDPLDVLEVTLNNRINVQLNKGEAQKFVFEAPGAGFYSLTTQNGVIYNASDEWLGSNSWTGNLEKNEKLYAVIYNTSYTGKLSSYVSVTGNVYEELSSESLDEKGEMKIKGGQTIRYQAPETNYYTFSLLDEEGNVVNSRSVSLEKGEYGSVSLGGNGDQTYTLKVTKRETESALAVGGEGAALSLKVNEERWYSFTADETNYYTFYMTDASGMIEAAVYNSLKDTYIKTSFNSDTAYAVSLKKGQTICFRLASDEAAEEAAVTGKLHVNKRNLDEAALNIGGTGKNLSLKAGEEYWYAFTADETNYYTFYTTGATGATYASLYDSMSANDSIGEEWGYNDFRLETQIRKGDTVYLRTTAPNAVEGTPVTAALKVSKRGAGQTALTLGENGFDITLTQGEEKWYSFTADQANCYTFYTENATGTVAVELYNSLKGSRFASQTGNDDFSYAVSLDAGKTVYLKLTAPDAGTASSVTAKLKVSRRELEGALPVGISPEITLTGKEKWYSFTADETNCYTFRTSDESVRIEYYESLMSPDAADSGNSRLEGYIRNGRTVYLRLFSDSATAEVPVKTTLKITKRVLQEPALAVGGATGIELQKDGELWYTFTADENNYYTFYSTGATGKVEIYRYDDLKDTHYREKGNSSRSDFKYEVYLTKDQTIYLKLNAPGAADEESVEATMKVAKREVKAELAVGGEGVSLSLGANEDQWYSFTADEVNLYTFYTTEATGNVKAEFYSDLTDFWPNPSADGNKDFKESVGMHEGQTYYLKLSSTNATEEAPVTANLFVSKRNVESALPLGGEGVLVSLGKDEEKWYSFTAPEQNTYYFWSEEATENVRIEVYSSLERNWPDRSNDGNKDFRASIDMPENQIYYLKLSSANATEETPVTAKVKVGALQELPELSLTEDNPLPVKLENCQWQWVRFTAAEDGSYKFYSKNLDGTAYVQMYREDKTSVVDNISMSPGRVTEILLSAGETYYLKIIGGRNSSGYFPVSLDVCVRYYDPDATGELTLDGPEMVDLFSNEYRWLSFTAAENGIYWFYSEDSAGTSGSSVWVYSDREGTEQLTSNGTYTSGSNYFCRHEMKAGDTVYLKLGSYSSYYAITFNAYVRKIDAAEELTLTEDKGLDIAVNAGDYQWVAFTAPETATYHFYTDMLVKNGIRIELYSGKEETGYLTYTSNYSNNVYLDYELTTGATYYLKIKGANSSRDCDTVLYVKKLDPSEATVLSDTAVTGELVLGECRWYTYTPENSGVYEFYFIDAVPSSPGIGLYNGIDGTRYYNTADFSVGNHRGLAMEVTAGTSYCIKAGPGIDALKYSYAVQAKERTYKALTDAGETCAIPADDALWYTYTASEAGDYFFYTKEASDAVEFKFYTNNTGSNRKYGTDFSDGNDRRCKLALSENETVYIMLSSGGKAATAQVFGERFVPKELALTVSDAGCAVALDQGEYANAGFVPSEDSVYLFYTTDSKAGVRLTLWDGSSQKGYGDSYNGNAAFISDGELTAGTAYRVKVEGSNNGKVDCVLHVKKYDADAETPLTEGTEVSGQLVPRESIWYTFTPQRDGVYRFKVDSDTSNGGSVALYESKDGSSVGYINNGVLKQEMKAGTTYYFKATCSGYEVWDYKVSVKEVVIPVLELDTPLAVEVAGTTVEYLKFVAPKDGEYSFYSSENADTYGYLYSDLGVTKLADDDDSGEGSNFKITWPLSAGDTVYVGVRYYNSNNSGNIEVHAEYITAD